MTVSRFDDVIDAIDNLIEDEIIEPAPVRFTANTLSDQDIEDFISATLARGEDGMGTPAATTVVAPEPQFPRTPRRRSYGPSRTPAPRPNRYDATCNACRMTVAAGDGVLVRGHRGWLVTHNTCPTVEPTRRRRTAPSRQAAVEPVVDFEADGDCYVVTVEVEVVKDGVRTAREAALLALREVFTGEVAVSVTTPDNRTAEVNVTM